MWLKSLILNGERETPIETQEVQQTPVDNVKEIYTIFQKQLPSFSDKEITKK